uniref:Putative nuclease HARBI1 n=1 Tax=Magallana gigas TaxID=29159 RepID=A0A8W8J8F9_MAGGI
MVKIPSKNGFVLDKDNPGQIEVDWDVIDRRLLELDGKIVTSLKCKKRNSLVESFLGFLKASPGSPTLLSCTPNDIRIYEGETPHSFRVGCAITMALSGSAENVDQVMRHIGCFELRIEAYCKPGNGQFKGRFIVMEHYFDEIDQIYLVERLIRRERIVRDRTNPFLNYSEEEFIDRFRLRKECVLELLNEIGEHLEPKQTKVSSISPLNQLLIALRFYGTGCFIRVCGDLFGVHEESSVSRIVKRVSSALTSRYKNYVVFPSGNRVTEIQRGFMNHSGIPGIVGAIDCTHIPIQSPGGDMAELFRNRKGFFSINVQAICDNDLMLTNVVARWPGSTHDSRIFENSSVCARFERRNIPGILIGDNGYPLRSYLITPLLTCRTPQERRFNFALSNSRVKIENVFGIWKRRFPCLRNQLRFKISSTLHIIIACAVLYNIARKAAIPVPDDDYEGDIAVPVPVLPNANQGGQALRAVLIRHFQ